jgi:hypothetical protein
MANDLTANMREEIERLQKALDIAHQALDWYSHDGDFWIVDGNGEKVTQFANFGSRARNALAWIHAVERNHNDEA